MHTKSCERQIQDAEYEADRARDEADRLRRQMARDKDDREEQRKEEHRRAHPSNQLYNGEVTDFREAVQLRIAALSGEIIPPAADDPPELKECMLKCNDSMREGIMEAQRAKEVYERIMASIEGQIVEALRQENLKHWVDCLSSGDYLTA